MSNHAINYRYAESYFSEKQLDAANLFRRLALLIDANPAAIQESIQEPIFEELCLDRTSSCIERTQLIEALSYGDAGVALAAPGPSLAGLMIRELGNPEQNERFFSYLKNHRCPTFLAVTEPNKGSDAANMQTTLSQNVELTGEKCFIGHGADAPIGVLMARKSQGPLGICAILLTTEELEQAQVRRIPLDMLGLRGARLGKISLNQVKIPRENILGQHLSPIKGGLMSMMKTFNRMRPAVAAFALGHAQAILDYARENFEDFPSNAQKNLLEMNAEISMIRSLLYACAKKVDENPYENVYASIAKYNATRLAEKITFSVMKYFGTRAYEGHPLLIKWYRDVWGFEYMEGTSVMQLKNIYQSFLKNQMVAA